MSSTPSNPPPSPASPTLQQEVDALAVGDLLHLTSQFAEEEAYYQGSACLYSVRGEVDFCEGEVRNWVEVRTAEPTAVACPPRWQLARLNTCRHHALAYLESRSPAVPSPFDVPDELVGIWYEPGEEELLKGVPARTYPEVLLGLWEVPPPEETSVEDLGWDRPPARFHPSSRELPIRAFTVSTPAVTSLQLGWGRNWVLGVKEPYSRDLETGGGFKKIGPAPDPEKS